MRFERLSPEVFVDPGPVMTFDREDVEELKAQALKNPSRKARVCAHPTIEDRLHEMFIVHARGAYIRPHKHVDKSESFHMIEGRLTVVLFEEDGNVHRVVEMCDSGWPGALFYRLSTGLYHMVIPRSDVVVFHETTNGPFVRDDTFFAPWSPDERDGAAVARFLRHVGGEIDRRRGR